MGLGGFVADRYAIEGGPGFAAVGVGCAYRHAFLGFSGGPGFRQIFGVHQVPFPSVPRAEGCNGRGGGMAADADSGGDVGGDLLRHWIPRQAFGTLAIRGNSKPRAEPGRYGPV